MHAVEFFQRAATVHVVLVVAERRYRENNHCREDEACKDCHACLPWQTCNRNSRERRSTCLTRLVRAPYG